MNDFEKMAELLLPNIDKTPEYYENMYPSRNLPEGARVTRIAPSPTGYLHLGTLFAALVNRITATSTGGVFYTRIEDTDKKREIEGGIEDIISGLDRFGIKIDEGFVAADKQSGEYGPYKQSERAEIYQTYAKSLIKQGLAYPCFCTAEELDEVRKVQEEQKERTGYHGKWAKHRDITFDEAKTLIDEGKPYVVRLKSPGNEENRIVFDDCVKGKIEMPENDEDFVILKSDGIPTYHFAHAVDDHLMHTTHVLRGDEWISSVPKHIQLFKLLGFKPPKYGHISPIMKLDNGAKRKISKRKDPEAAVHFFAEQGYDSESVIEYLMTIAASDFEDWRRANPDKSYKDFKFNLKKMSVSGALFDSDKLNDVSKTVISKLDGNTVYYKLTDWAKEFDPEFYEILTEKPDYSKAMLSIDRDVPKPRKDIAKWNDSKDYFSYFFEKLYTPDFTLPENISPEDAAEFLKKYKSVYNTADDRQQWFDKIKQIAPEIGFAAETKQYKADPQSFKGHAGDLSTVLRIAVTGRRNTPDLCSIMQFLVYDTCISRIDAAINSL
ncbi:MAG: glutamate--tRNA ligase [Acutalibacteraceae bacterium]|nr:glutamate--tRNA ligase [Acutalibacteraceae bacterium]